LVSAQETESTLAEGSHTAIAGDLPPASANGGDDLAWVKAGIFNVKGPNLNS